MDNIFDNEKIAVEQLLKDKHTLLEGYVTEQLFYNQFLSNGNTSFSNGWWMTTYNGKKIFFIVKDQLTEFEQELINMIPSPHQCWQVYLKRDKYIFLRESKILTQEEFIDTFKLKRLRAPMVAAKYARNKERQIKSIEFFKKNGIIKKIAIGRRFANNFLTVYFNRMINIDFLTKKNNQFNIIEVKYKYESRDGYFGINKGQMEMFKFFISLGFNVYHFILYNHTKDRNISIFGYLDLPENKNWYYAKLNDISTHGIGVAPEMTSVSGEFKQSYYKLPIKKIRKRKIQFKIINK